MIDIRKWLFAYQKAINAAFGNRVLFIGLQGSYARGEDTEKSDLDVVLILDRVTMEDLNIYKKITAVLPHSELLCGFVSGKMELTHWCRHDLFQFYFDTINIQGSLDTIISPPTALDAKQAVLVGACNIYHGCSHNYLHAMDADALQALYKAAFFVLQTKHFCETGEYVNRRAKLADCLAGDDLAVLQQSGNTFEGQTATLLAWASRLIELYKTVREQNGKYER
ncbi:MAG: nucleotidyltransferase domain-containing protein [Oscillospiraceae bacterium]